MKDKNSNKFSEELKKDESGNNRSKTGEITNSHSVKAIFHTETGGKRIIDMIARE